MESETQIKSAIEEMVRMYSLWTIGVADERGRAIGNPIIWHQWDAGTEFVARKIQEHFIAKGMKEGTGIGETADHVFIFM